jgi:hypothetical protein
MSSAFKRPTRRLDFIFGIVDILSTIAWDSFLSPLAALGLIGNLAYTVLIAAVVKGQTVIEDVLSKSSLWTMIAGRGLPT